ncbi:RHS repeat protein [Streptomyces durbertensis]|uniref:RHS repeat protein n=1 Tax=Streptomyces durbertensis TaxID=2448886 RepID=A0ABR6EAF6_9ACTN|nr:RHS repeat-associated core domain-containing protein [Streptomyces durbertensis]MBB1242228.1 RHS repeat protein [Streptomyces durbertensis]
MSSLLGTQTAAAVERLKLGKLQETKPVPVQPVDVQRADGRNDAARDARGGVPEVTWPKAATARIELPERAGQQKRAGRLPVHLGQPEPDDADSRNPGKSGGKADGRRGKRAAEQAADTAPQRAQVQVLSRRTATRLGVDGVLLAVRGTDGEKDNSVRLTLDYSDFARAYGAGWASRLTLVRLPECALEDPDTKRCAQAEPLETENNSADGTLTADVPVDGTADAAGDPVVSAPRSARSVTGFAASPGVTLLAATAAPSGGGGDYKATPLSPSGHWNAGGSSGGFSWAYDIQVPEAPGGLDPELGLSYSSQSLDGRTAATNNQSNWVGDGWSLTENYIERRHASCNEDTRYDGKDGNNATAAKNGELCWRSDNATMSLNGQSHELVRDDTTGDWKLKDDDGTRVERLTDTARGNGDNNGEYWRITTTDGVQYHFGYNRLPGWSSGKPETNSTWTVPVHGNHTGEPCHKSAFKDSWCQQAWRWNLDFVKDPSDNATAYYYAAETNRYARHASATTGLGTPTEYTRGGHMSRIEYGLRADDMYGTNAAAARVDFTVAERCLPDTSFDCAPAKMTAANAKRWPDVPVDQHCKAGEDCKGKSAPTFWTTKRLTKITTKVLVGSGYQSVDSWTLRHQFPDPGDGSTPALWLAGVTRTGHTGASAQSLPEVTFLGQQLANRVDTTGDGIPPIVRYRVRQINTESGGSIGVTYSAPDCKPGDLPAESTNTRRCYPVYWSSADSPAADFKPVKDWFHKYVVTRVLENDLVGGSPTQQTDYTYVGGAAWGKSEDEFTRPEHRTYSDFRGYGEVRTQVGNGTDGARLDSRARYFRGIAGAKVADFEGNEVTDHPSFRGMERAEITYNGGEVVGEETSTPWRKGPTASRARPGLPALAAEMTDVREETTRGPAKGGGWQRTKTERTFDSYGMVATETEHGDTARSGDESCTTTTYARNTSANILELTASEKTTEGTCAVPGALISESRSYYDGSTTLGAVTRGDTTREDENNAKGTGFLTVARTTYDDYGRPTRTTDAEGRSVTHQYTPATGMPTKTVVTNPLGHTHTTEIDPRRGVAVAEVDANGKRTDVEYDALGRVVKVWEPGRAKATYPTSPNAEYEYRISRTAPAAITTRELRGDGSTETSYVLYDGLLRERQHQSRSASGSGRILTETQFDSRGLEWKTFDDYYATGDPEPALVTGDDTKSPAVVRTVFDGAGRPTESVAMKYGTETRRTKLLYDGNHTTVVPPAGGTATTNVTDALGRTTEVVEYTNAARTASQSVTYEYNKKGHVTKITDPAGNVRSFEYDLRGQRVRTVDPDQGETTTTYDDLGRPLTTTDARGVKLTTSYDALGRTTAVREGDKTLAEWTYDTVAKGEIAESRRLVGGSAYVQRITGYNNDYQATGVDVVIPDSEGDLAGTYRWGFGYNERTGLLTQINQPAVGDLPAERVVTRYGADDQAQGLTANGRVLVNSTTYDPFGRKLRNEFNDQVRRVYRTWNYDEHTGELRRVTTDRTASPNRVDDTRYTFDDAGNITRINTETEESTRKDTQCFTTDALQRLTKAWTAATDDCAAAPSKADVGGPAPYWLSYSYDALGNRTKETRHDTGGDSTKDTVRTYDYKGADGGPTALNEVRTSGPASGTDTFRYDAAGNTVGRQVGSREQTLSWDAENLLSEVREKNGATTRYTYDAEGERLLRKDSTGTTLYLPGGNELKLTGDGKKAGTRYYDFDGEIVAVRTGGDLQFHFTDHHGTATTVVDATTQQAQHRYSAPFGEDRGEVVAGWPGDRGFVGGTRDETGLTQLGARAYDPALGRFLSVDPMVDYGESQRMNAYAYANNNPVTFSDADGLFFGKAKNWVKDKAKKVTKKAKSFKKKVVKKAKSFKKKVKAKVESIRKTVRTVKSRVKATAKRVATAAVKRVTRAVSTVKRWKNTASSYVKRKASSARSFASKAAKSTGKFISKNAGRAVKGVAAVGGFKAAYDTFKKGGAANILGGISALTGAAATFAAPFPVLAGALAVVSVGTGLASAAVHAAQGNHADAKNALVGAALGVGGGFGRIGGAAAKAVAGGAPRATKFLTDGVKAALPKPGSAKTFTGITGRTYSGGYQNFVTGAAHTAVDSAGNAWAYGTS